MQKLGYMLCMSIICLTLSIVIFIYYVVIMIAIERERAINE